MIVVRGTTDENPGSNRTARSAVSSLERSDSPKGKPALAGAAIPPSPPSPAKLPHSLQPVNQGDNVATLFSKPFMHSSLRMALMLASILLLPTTLPASTLLVFDSNSTASVTDCEGISQALDETGMAYSVLDTSSGNLGVPELANHRVAVACHLALDASQAQLLDDWVAIGGNLLATGRSAHGLEPALGLDSVAEMAPQGDREMRFTQSHPVTTGSWWEGVITGPAMPEGEKPPVIRHWYFTDDWPAFAAIPGQAVLLARWNATSDD
jgi:hypothetical protein